jgi:hypothetical protein
MIYLFDNCYLSTTNNIVENAKHIWIGNFPSFDENAFDTYKTYTDITPKKLDDLFEEIHTNLSDKKTIIYCDVEYFQYVYSIFFNGVLSKAAVLELYSYDRTKENLGLGNMNYGLSVTGNRDINTVELPEELEWVRGSSSFSAALTNQRIELEFATAIQGDVDSTAFCIDRIDQMYDGSPGFWVKYAEQTLPGIMSDEEYTIENILDSEYVETYLDQFKVDEFIPNTIVPIIKDKFGYDYHEHFFTIINSDENYKEFLEPILSMTKREFIETRVLNPQIAVNYNLIFPNLSNFDSLNPIFWNAILKNKDNTVWLSKYKVTHGTDNQTNGTV